MSAYALEEIENSQKGLGTVVDNKIKALGAVADARVAKVPSSVASLLFCHWVSSDEGGSQLQSVGHRRLPKRKH